MKQKKGRDAGHSGDVSGGSVGQRKDQLMKTSDGSVTGRAGNYRRGCMRLVIDMVRITSQA